MKLLTLLLISMPIIINAMSIEEVVQKTIQTNPQVEVKKEDLNTEKALLKVSKSDYLPTLDLDYSVGPEKIKTISEPKSDTNEIRHNASLTLKQNIFAGFDTINSVKQQDALILSATKGVNEIANSIALEVVGAYIDILRNKELLDISQENIVVHEKYLKQIKEKVDAGVGRLSDYQQTLSRYENTKSIYYLNEQNYKNAFYNFQRLLPTDMKVENMIKPKSGELPVQSLEELTQMALKKNPSILLSQSNVEYAKVTMTRSKSNYYPRVDLVAQTYWNKNLNNPNREENGYNALVVFKYNIFNGLFDTSTIKANQYKLLSQRASLINLKRLVEASTKTAWQIFQSTQRQIVHIDKNIEASAQTVKDYQKENELGRRSIIDLLNIELEYNNAKNRKVRAEYDHLLAYYQILAQVDKILEEMSVVIK